MCPVFVRGLKDSATQQVEYFYEKAAASVKLAVAMANDSNFDRNPVRGCNYGLEGGAFSI